MFLFNYLIFLADAKNQYKKHSGYLNLIQQRFDGRCTDEYATFDFKFDMGSYEKARGEYQTYVWLSMLSIACWVLMCCGHCLCFTKIPPS